MERRAFLRGVGAAGGATLAAGLPHARAAHAQATRGSAAARGRVFDRLRQAGLEVTARLTRFDGPAATTGELVVDAGGNTRRVGGGALTVRALPVAGRPDAVDLLATFKLRGPPIAAAIGLRLRLSAWSRDHYLVLPGACYAGNRFESRHVSYPPLLSERADIGPNVPPIVSDIPRLNLHPGPSELDLLAADLASPAAGVFAPDARLGIILLVDPTTSMGRTGFTVAENDERTSATIDVSAPFAYGRSRSSGPAAGSGGRRPANLRDGEQVTLRARVFLFDCADVPALFARLFAVRKDLTGKTTLAHELPFSAAFAAHEERVNHRWQETSGFYALGARDSAYSTWQNGWSSGLATGLPLLAAGAPRSRERARRQSAFVIGEGQAASGFFHALTDGKTWYDDGFSAPLPGRGSPPSPAYKQAQRWHLVRRSADTLLLLMKQLAFHEQRPEPAGGEKLQAGLARSARRVADAFVRQWDRYHQLGQFVDVETGDLVVGGSTSAGAAPAGLALAAAQFSHDGYLRVARAAAELYNDRYVRLGLTCGGPGDALQCPDSQSAAGLLESFVTLYEVTREPIWIERARAAAHLLASWVISYEPPGNEAGTGEGLGGGLRATGGVLSDAQGGRGSPGYLVSSGDALFRLYRATGDVALLELLRDTVHNLAQYLPGLDRPPPAADAGLGRPESATRTDPRRWLEQAGEIAPAAGVFDAIALCAYTEVPGLYAQLDTGFVFAFDHVGARIRERMAGKLVVALTNPTRTEASVRLYAETSADAARPLAAGAIVDAPTAVVPPGATLEVLLPVPVAMRR